MARERTSAIRAVSVGQLSERISFAELILSDAASAGVSTFGSPVPAGVTNAQAGAIEAYWLKALRACLRRSHAGSAYQPLAERDAGASAWSSTQPEGSTARLKQTMRPLTLDLLRAHSPPIVHDLHEPPTALDFELSTLSPTAAFIQRAGVTFRHV